MDFILKSKIPVAIFGILSILFLGLTAAAFGVLKSYQDTINQRTYDSSGIGALQLRVHYEAVMAALVEHDLAPSPRTLDAAVLQYDILFERVGALPSRAGYELLLDVDDMAAHAEIQSVMRAHLPKIDRAAEGDASALDGLREIMNKLRPAVQRLAHHPVQMASERRGLVTAEFRRLSDFFLMVIGGFVIAGLIFAAIIWRQLGQAARRHDELQELTKSLERARADAERASEIKSEFLSHMSHELRTPMNSVLGFAQLLQAQDLDAKQKQAVGQIMRSGNLLMHLIDQVLELNRIVSGHIPVTVQSTSPSTVITDCLSMMESLAAERSISLGASRSMYHIDHFETDPKRLQQILLNLMSNAIKYNYMGGEVMVSCDALDNDWLRFTVTDTGEGFAMERKDELFQPFNRLGRETMGIEGGGIGLTIARELVHVLGGRIDFTSAIGKGSSFWVDLPIKGPQTEVYTDFPHD